MLGKIWKKALVFILIVACLFNIVRKIVRKNSLREELQATLDYFNAKNQKVQENIVENNKIINSVNTQQNNNKMIESNNQVTVEKNQIIQQTPTVNNQEQQVITNNQEIQTPYININPNEQQYVQQQNNGQGTQDLMPITQSEIEQNMQARMKATTEQQINR